MNTKGHCQAGFAIYLVLGEVFDKVRPARQGNKVRQEWLNHVKTCAECKAAKFRRYSKPEPDMGEGPE